MRETAAFRIDETWYQRPPGVPDRISAGGVVVRLDGERPVLALVRERFLHLLPKGGVERGETLEQAARREIEEEAGLSELDLVRPLGQRARLDFRKRRWVTTHYFLFTTRQVVGFPTDRRHDYVLAWHPLDAIPELFWPEQAALIQTHAAEIEQTARRLQGGDSR